MAKISQLTRYFIRRIARFNWNRDFTLIYNPESKDVLAVRDNLVDYFRSLNYYPVSGNDYNEPISIEHSLTAAQTNDRIEAVFNELYSGLMDWINEREYQNAIYN